MRRFILLSISLLALHPFGPSLRAQEAEGVGLLVQPWAGVFLPGTEPHRQLLPLFLDVRTGDDVDPFARALVGADLDVTLGNYLSFGFRFHYDTEATNHPLARTHALEAVGSRTDLDEAYVTAAGGLGSLTLGRQRIAWGRSPLGGLGLSGMAPAFEVIRGQLNLPWGHTLESFLGRLSSEDGLTRLLYGHRWTLNFGGTFSIGVSDLTLTAEEGVNLYWPFLVPWIPNVLAEMGNFPGLPPGNQVNSQLGVEVEWRPGPRLYGEWLADDSKTEPGQDSRARRWAFLLGVEHQPGFFTVGYEYRRIGSWTYTHFSHATEFRNYRWPLSAPEGPDMDRHVVWGMREGAQWEVSIRGEKRRRGENRLGTLWTRGGYEGEPFPSGIVEGRWIVSAGVARDVDRYGVVHLDGFFQDITSVNNESGADEGVFGFQLSLHLRPPPFSNH